MIGWLSEALTIRPNSSVRSMRISFLKSTRADERGSFGSSSSTIPTSLLFFLSMFLPPHSMLSLSVPRSLSSFSAPDNPFPTATSWIASSGTISSLSSSAGCSSLLTSLTSVHPPASSFTYSWEALGDSSSCIKTSSFSGLRASERAQKYKLFLFL